MNHIIHALRTTQGYRLAVVFLLTCLVAGCDTAAPPKGSSTTKAQSPSPVEAKIGILLVSHGSRSKSWCKMVLCIEDAVRDELLQDQEIAGVRSAFMEYQEPSIASQMKEFDREGYADVILVPLLMTVSSHSFDDIPTIIGQKRDHKTLETLRLEGIEVYKPKAKVHMAPLLDFPEVLQNNVARRVKKMSQNPKNEGIVLVAYGAEQYEKQWEKLIKQVAEHVRQETGVTCIEHSWCGHIVRYKSEPTEKAIKKVLDQKKRALVLPVLVAVDEMFQGKIIGGAIKNVNEGDRIAYRHDAILPDEDINRWVVEISRQVASKLVKEPKTSDAASE